MKVTWPLTYASSVETVRSVLSSQGMPAQTRRQVRGPDDPNPPAALRPGCAIVGGAAAARSAAATVTAGFSWLGIVVLPLQFTSFASSEISALKSFETGQFAFALAASCSKVA